MKKYLQKLIDLFGNLRRIEGNKTQISEDDVLFKYNELHQLDFEKANPEVIEERVRNFLRGNYTQILVGIQEHDTFYRAIPYGKDNKPATFSFLGCNPNRRLNRVNLEGELVFYTSNSPGGPYKELNARIGDYFVLSSWFNTHQLRVGVVGFSERHFEQKNSKRKLPRYTSFEWMKGRKKYNYIIQKYIQELIADDFCQVVSEDENYLYKLTNAYANALGFKDQSDGIMYPSIPGGFNSDNIAIYEKSLNKMKFSSATWVEIIGFSEEKGYELQFHDYANEIGDEDEILWKGRPPQVTMKLDLRENYSDVHLNASEGLYDDQGKLKRSTY